MCEKESSPSATELLFGGCTVTNQKEYEKLRKTVINRAFDNILTSTDSDTIKWERTTEKGLQATGGKELTATISLRNWNGEMRDCKIVLCIRSIPGDRRYVIWIGEVREQSGSFCSDTQPEEAGKKINELGERLFGQKANIGY